MLVCLAGLNESRLEQIQHSIHALKCGTSWLFLGFLERHLMPVHKN